MRRTKRMNVAVALTLAVTTLAVLVSAAYSAEPLPIIPGAAGFGMDTPAGSGRHLRDVSLKLDWDASLVGHWNFDDGAAGDGTLAGDAAVVKRDKGHALSLKGKGSLKLANARGYVKPGGSFTVMAWVHLNAIGGMLAENRGDGESSWELGSTASFGGKWRFHLANSARETIHATWNSGLSPGKWRHVAAVYDDDGTIRLYLNGVMVHNGWGKSLKQLAAARSSHLVLGRGLDGKLDDVMLFDRPLTEKQILAMYARQQDASLPSPADVYRVTNLTDSGPGSLREGIQSQERARTIVFEVSGNIELKQTITLKPNNGYLTIAGATAPSPGITIKGHGLRIDGGCHDVLIQHLRIRTGDTSIVGKLTGDWTDVDGGGPGAVFSHPLEVEPQKHYGGGSRRSVWWNGKDLAEDPGKTTRVGLNQWDWDSRTSKKNATRSTEGVLYVNVGGDPAKGKVEYGLSKSSVADPLTMTPGTRNIVVDHLTCTWGGDMNMQTQGSHIAIQNCLIAEALHHPRHPKGAHSRGLLVFAYGPGQAHYVSVLGNLFAYNMARNPTVAKGHMVLVANNLVSDVNVGIKCGDSRDIDILLSVQKNVVRRSNYPLLARVVSEEPEKSKIHISPDNRVDGKTFASVADTWEQAVTNPFKTGDVPEICQVETSPVTVPGLKLRPVDQIEQWVLANAGARPADRDPVDQRIIRNVKTGEGKLPIASQDEVGGWPQLEENRRELTVPEKPHGDDDGDGYTNLEEWLHGFAAEVEGRSD